MFVGFNGPYLQAMNFVAHYYLDKDSTDSLFFIGIATPDLVSAFDRSVRLKKGTLPTLQNTESSSQQSFYQGVQRHFEGDRIFHNSNFFHQETRFLTQKLKDTFGPTYTPRAFFVAHILLELVLDRILIMQHNDLLFRFYNHFEQKDVKELAELTRWVCKAPMFGYENFLQKFSERKFLYNYTEWEYLIKVTCSILKKVNILKYAYLHSDEFIDLIEDYEEQLTGKIPKAFQELYQELGQKTPS